MTDLKKIVGNRLLMAISECRRKRNDYMVMVCDDYTLKVLSSILRIHQVNDAGVGGSVFHPGTTAHLEPLNLSKSIHCISQ